jgi:hypothetical protein
LAEPHAFVLIHSPIVGASTWRPVADVLAARGLAASFLVVFD